MKKVKGFNFDTVRDKYVLDHIEKQGNQSNYIKNLVKNDMDSNNIAEIVRKQVDIHLENIAKSIKNSPE